MRKNGEENKCKIKYKNKKIKSFESTEEILENPNRFNDYFDKVYSFINKTP